MRNMIKENNKQISEDISDYIIEKYGSLKNYADKIGTQTRYIKGQLSPERGLASINIKTLMAMFGDIPIDYNALFREGKFTIYKEESSNALDLSVLSPKNRAIIMGTYENFIGIPQTEKSYQAVPVFAVGPFDLSSPYQMEEIDVPGGAGFAVRDGDAVKPFRFVAQDELISLAGQTGAGIINGNISVGEIKREGNIIAIDTDEPVVSCFIFGVAV